jgi:hypothetical protein
MLKKKFDSRCVSENFVFVKVSLTENFGLLNQQSKKYTEGKKFGLNHK